MELSEAVKKLQDLIIQLREECPWDKKQTHDSLKRHLIEEAYETIEAIDALEVGAADQAERYGELKDELGDLLYQVFFHSLLASEVGQFEIQDVVENISDKLYRRHPHIFGNLEIENEEELAPHWEEIKKVEKDTESVMDKLPSNLPALLFASKIQKKAKALGLFESSPRNSDLKKLIDNYKGEAVVEQGGKEKISADEIATREKLLGELLWEAVTLAADLNLDPEDVLRRTSKSFAEAIREKETGSTQNQE